jgi:general L-amino acid transport system ATP-binding protein
MTSARRISSRPARHKGEVHQEAASSCCRTELTDDLRALDTIRREAGMVFHSFNLFPHLTILENCALAPIWSRKMP